VLNCSKAWLLARRLADYGVIWAAGLLRDVTPVQLEGYTSYCHPKFWNTALNLSNPVIQAQFQNAIQHIRNAHDFVRAHNTQFLVVLIPCKEMIYGPITRQFDSAYLLMSYDEFKKRLENLGIQTLNLTTPFINAEVKDKQKVLFLRTDVHLTESGHNAAADMIVRFMKNNGLLRKE